MRVPFLLLLALSLALPLLLPWGPPRAVAAVQTCAGTDIADASGDVSQSPADASPVTGFDQLDITKLCVAETADAVDLILTMVASVAGGGATGDFTWTIHFKQDGQAKQSALRSASGTNTFTPPGSGEISAARIQFLLPRSTTPPGSNLSAFSIDTSGTFAPTIGDVVTGSDRAPDGAGSVAAFTYTVGARAPETLDSDQDGIPDRQEVAAGTNPGKADTDEDGVNDGDEKTAGTDPLDADSDDDGLIDGANLTLSSTTTRAQNLTKKVSPTSDLGTQRVWVGEASLGTGPVLNDTDSDGLLDGAEVLGTNNPTYPRRAVFPDFPGSTDPRVADTDGDRLLDGQETEGRAMIDGTRHDFSPSDPNDPDTDGDGLTDFEEVTGRVHLATGEDVTFAPTNPANRDTDGDGFDDFQEISGSGGDPNDPNKEPTSGGPGGELGYLLMSALSMVVVLFVSAAGILWRWA